MGVPSDDAVLIEKGRRTEEPWVFTVNCPDKTGLGCDICRTILEFGLYITKGDVSTDGKWCYVVLWVVPHSRTRTVRWDNLKERLVSVCPSCSLSYYYNPPAPRKSSPLYLLKFFCLDKRGLLYDVTQLFSELELTIERVKVMTNPDNLLDELALRESIAIIFEDAREQGVKPIDVVTSQMRTMSDIVQGAQLQVV